MRRKRQSAFTLLELMTVVVIIMVLAAMVVGVATMARRAARVKRCNAAIELLATAVEDYWSQYRDYPYPEPAYVGDGVTRMSEVPEFRDRYYGHEEAEKWDNEARNVTLVWMLSEPRDPAPWLDTNQFCFEGVKVGDHPMRGPDKRPLFRIVDGFKNPIRVTRPSQYYYSRTWIELVSAGGDQKFGDADGDEDKYKADKEDNIVRKIMR